MHTITLREMQPRPVAARGAWPISTARGMDCFDRSVEGFWRSFWAAAVMAPAYIADRLRCG